MTDYPDGDPEDREHVGADPDESPFDHGCNCPVCKQYRREVLMAIQDRELGRLTDEQFDVAMRRIEGDAFEQARLSAF